jgi:hypothetical protein
MGKTSGHSSVSGRRLTAIVLACVAALATATAVAVASRGVTKNANVSFPPDTKQTATTTCPPKTHISGGGFQVSPGATPGGTVESFTTNSNFSGGKSWTVTSGATAASPSATLTATARCERKRDGRIAVVLPATRTITPDTTPPYQAVGINLQFICPPQTHPIGGGYSVDKPFDPNNVGGTNKFFATQNRRTGSTWTIGGYLLGGPSASTPPAEFTAKVACESNGTRPVRERSSLVPYTDNARATATATCRTGTHLVSGGFSFSPTSGFIPVPFIDRNVPATGRAWTVSAYDSAGFGAPPGSTMTSHAYCRKNKPKPRRRRARSGAASAAQVGEGSVRVVPLPPATVLAE